MIIQSKSDEYIFLDWNYVFTRAVLCINVGTVLDCLLQGKKTPVSVDDEKKVLREGLELIKLMELPPGKRKIMAALRDLSEVIHENYLTANGNDLKEARNLFNALAAEYNSRINSGLYIRRGVESC